MDDPIEWMCTCGHDVFDHDWRTGAPCLHGLGQGRVTCECPWFASRADPN